MAAISEQKDAYFSAAEYKQKKLFFPAPYLKKDNNFFLNYFQAMYSEYLKDKGGIPYSRRFDFNLYRLYAEGNQPTEKYMNILAPMPKGKSNNEEREGWMNISWDILSVAPKFRRIFTGMFEKIEHEVVCTAINDKALGAKEDFKWKLWAEKELQSYNRDLDQQLGTNGSEPEWIPDTMQELEMFMNESFKLPTEIAMESGIEYAFYLSQWTEVKKRMLEDWFDIGVAACQDYVDKIDDKVKCKYLDPARLIIRYSRDKQFSNIDYWGHIEDWTIAELRQKGKFKEEELYKIAHMYCNFADNFTDFAWSDYYNLTSINTNNSNSQLPYDNYRVNVMFGEFITSETKKVKTVKLNDGSTKTYVDKKVPEEEWMSANKEDRSVENSSYQIAMCGYWVVGTQYVFNCEPSYVQPRPEKKNPKLSINIYKYSNKSILASIIPNLDSFQLTWLKLQNAKAIAAPEGLQIEIGSLENISIGDKEFTPLDILTLRRSTGDLLYKATTHFSEGSGVGSGNPVTRLTGGIGEQLNESISSMEYDMKIIRDLTGINETIDSSSPKERTPVGTSEMAAEAANNSLQPIYSGYVTVKDSVSKKMVSRYQALAAKGKLKGYYPSLGSNIVKIFEMGSDVTAEEYAIKIQAKPTDALKQEIRNAAVTAMQLGKKQGGITTPDYLYIVSKIEDGKLKYAWLYLDYKLRKYEAESQQIAKANIQDQGKTQQELEQVKAKAAQDLIAAKNSGDINLENVSSQNRIKEAMIAHQNKMDEIAAQNSAKAQHIVVQGAVDAEVNKSAPKPLSTTK